MTTASMPIGCAILNNQASLNSGGVASLAGGEPFSFTTMETLGARGGIWVLSCSDTHFLTDDGGSLPFLRSNRFLATPMDFLAKELGAGDAKSARVGVQRVSEVLTRVVEMSATLDADVPRLIGSCPKSTLVSIIQSVVAPALRHEAIPGELLDALPSLFKPPAAIAAAGAQDLVVRLPATRLRLAQSVLGSAVPAGDWQELDMATYPNPASALSWVIGNRRPAICRVVIGGPVSPSNSSSGATRAMRWAATPLLRNLTAGSIRWMALPELIAMSRLVTMVPRRIFVASEYVPCQASLRVPPLAFAPSAQASISAGLLAEAYLHAVCSTSPMPMPMATADDAGGGHGTNLSSIRGVWLTAVARSYMLQEAMALADANFSVLSYNTSHVMVGVSKHNLGLLRKVVGSSLLLSYPAWSRMVEDRTVTSEKVAAAATAVEG